MNSARCRVIIPALNEEEAITKVIKDIPDSIVSEVIVVDNGSSDNTKNEAEAAGATVLSEPLRGYGAACLRGIAYVKDSAADTDIIVFLDADYSDHPEELPSVIKPILEDDIDLVIGSRALGESEKGSLTPVQAFGNWLSAKLLDLIYNAKFTDLGPFRAIKFNKLLALNMQDKNYGWTVEMQVKAAKQKLSFTEVPVKYRNRIGKSKVSGTVKGSILAGYKILYTIFKNI
ncbi:MAG: glycosyltransferase family 2 protein [Bacteroidetes bacterium]|nr:MAG: glycosyltransferase family 2 protein [Bacteroidota bacterium]